MAEENDPSADRLWSEYGRTFRALDDLTLARWMSQTLGQFQGGAWRYSHPLMGAYRLASQVGHDRQIWHKNLVSIPSAYADTSCCRAPLLPLVTREILDAGLICPHCNSTAIPFDEIPGDLQPLLRNWATQYGPVHAEAHREDMRKVSKVEQDRHFEMAARQAEQLLVTLGSQVIPKLLEYYPAVVWEDQDECLDVHPEDLLFG
jgi:hypothetical protein